MMPYQPEYPNPFGTPTTSYLPQQPRPQQSIFGGYRYPSQSNRYGMYARGALQSPAQQGDFGQLRGYQNDQVSRFIGPQGEPGTMPAMGGDFAAPLPPGGVYGQQKWAGGNGTDIFVRRGTPVYAVFDGDIEPFSGGQSPMGPVPGGLLRSPTGMAAQYQHVQLT